MPRCLDCDKLCYKPRAEKHTTAHLGTPDTPTSRDGKIFTSTSSIGIHTRRQKVKPFSYGSVPLSWERKMVSSDACGAFRTIPISIFKDIFILIARASNSIGPPIQIHICPSFLDFDGRAPPTDRITSSPRACCSLALDIARILTESPDI